MNTAVLALRLLRRDWRAGELRLLATALVIAVASVTSVGFFTDRIERAMQRQAAEVLAADLRLDSRHPLDSALSGEAQRRGLDTAETVSFPSVVLHQGATQLVQAKAVTPGYPLRGKLVIRDSATGEDQPTDAIPEPGEVWLEDRLLPLLGLTIGDSVKLGRMTFTVGRIIAYEPDRASNLFQLAPRVMFNTADLSATGLLGPASRLPRIVHRPSLFFTSTSGLPHSVCSGCSAKIPSLKAKHNSKNKQNIRVIIMVKTSLKVT